MLSTDAVVDLVKKQLWPAWRQERDRLDRLDHWYRWRHEDMRLPRQATPELKALAELSKIPWLGLVVTTVAQCMYVDGYRSGQPGDIAGDAAAGPWRTWQANRLDHRQIAVHRAMLAYGQSFMKVLPGEFAGMPTAVLRGVSPRNMHALYDDPAEDDWPRYAMQVVTGAPNSVRVYDDEAEYRLIVDSDASKVVFVEARAHNAGVCPVVRYSNMLDLDGRSPGEVEPHIAAAARINKTAYDRLVVQHFASWKVRTVAGMAPPDDEEELNRKKLQLSIDSILVADDPDTKFGSLDETPLGGFIEAWRADIEGLAAVTQTPAHALTGQLVNLSAEALAAARASLTQKVTERQKSAGESHAQALRLAAALEGDEESATDIHARVTWQDMEIRSMAQAVDALVKASTLGIPAEALWARIPGVEKADVDEWVEMAARADPLEQMQRELARQATSAVSTDVSTA